MITSLWVEGPQQVQYSLIVDEDVDVLKEETESEESSGPFTVTSTGLVMVRKALDHERRRTHRITVTNRTLATPPMMDYMTISVVVSFRVEVLRVIIRNHIDAVFIHGHKTEGS